MPQISSANIGASRSVIQANRLIQVVCKAGAKNVCLPLTEINNDMRKDSSFLEQVATLPSRVLDGKDNELEAMLEEILWKTQYDSGS